MVLTKALCVILKAVILFYRNICSNMKITGFKITPYNVNVINNIIERSQCTIICHIEDLKNCM